VRRENLEGRCRLPADSHLAAQQRGDAGREQVFNPAMQDLLVFHVGGSATPAVGGDVLVEREAEGEDALIAPRVSLSWKCA